MAEELDKILQNAENLMKEAEKGVEQGGEWGPDNLEVPYLNAIYKEVKALYEQNKAIIELLKNYKK